MKTTIQHNRPTLGREEIGAVRKAIKSGWIARGDRVKEFEDAISRYVGLPAEHAVALSSGTASIYLALKVLDIKPGDEVITPTYVCSAVLNAIYMIGACPVITDVDGRDFNISYEAAKKSVNERTRAIIVPHVFGVPADIKSLRKFAVPVIEDCATALGSGVDGTHVGLFGDLAIFSFYASKVITTGQGGMVVARDPGYIRRIVDYRQFDLRQKYYPRFNFQMTDIQAAMGIVQLKRLPGFLRKRRTLAGIYRDICFAKGWDFQRPTGGGCSPNWYRFVLKLSKNEVGRLKRYLKREGVDTIIPIQDWELLHRYMNHGGKPFGIATDVARTTLSLPIYPLMAEDGRIERVSKLLRRF